MTDNLHYFKGMFLDLKKFVTVNEIVILEGMSLIQHLHL